jgi:hypothetical protein
MVIRPSQIKVKVRGQALAGRGSNANPGDCSFGALADVAW